MRNNIIDEAMKQSLPKYTVHWTRPGDEDEVFVCSDLSAVKLVRRLSGAAQNFGSVTILKVESNA